MPDLLIICPETLKEFPSGVSADEQSYSSGAFENNSSQCPHCGKMHTWSKEHTRLASE